jgi:hypothetical protein
VVGRGGGSVCHAVLCCAGQLECWALQLAQRLRLPTPFHPSRTAENRPTALPRALRQVTGPHADRTPWDQGGLRACRKYLLGREAQRLKGPVASEEAEEPGEGEEAGGRSGGAEAPPLRQEFDVQALPASVEEFFARLPEGVVVLNAGALGGVAGAVRRPEVRVSEGPAERGSPVYVQMSAMADRARARRAAMEAMKAEAYAASALAAAAAAAAAAEARGVSGRTRSGRAGAAPSTTAGGRGGRGGKGVRKR